LTAYEEQEELDRLKAWWKNYGSSVIAGVLLGVVVLVGYRYWTQHREEQFHKAAALYEQMFQQYSSKNVVEARKMGDSLIRDFSSTPYAAMTELVLARLDFDANQLDKAKERLKWVMDNTKDASIRHVARLRLAHIVFDRGDGKSAMSLLDVNDRSGFEAEYEELKGDILLSQGQRDAARTAYREAMKNLPPGSTYAPMLNMKLDNLGSEKPS